MWSTCLSPRNIKELFPFVYNLSPDETEILEAVGENLDYEDIFGDDRFKLLLGNGNYIEIPKIFREIFLPLSSGYRETDIISNLAYSTDIDLTLSWQREAQEKTIIRKSIKSQIGFSYLMVYMYAFAAYSIPKLNNANLDPLSTGVGPATRINILATDHTAIKSFIYLSSSGLGHYMDNFVVIEDSLRSKPSKYFIQELCSNYLDNL